MKEKCPFIILLPSENGVKELCVMRDLCDRVNNECSIEKKINGEVEKKPKKIK